MVLKNSLVEVPKSIQWLRRISHISAWLLLAGLVVLAVSGWGITHTGIIYTATFGLINRRLADSIHRATNFPVAVFFVIHVLTSVRLAFSRRNAPKIWLIDSILIIVGVVLIALVLYMEYWA